MRATGEGTRGAGEFCPPGRAGYSNFCLYSTRLKNFGCYLVSKQPNPKNFEPRRNCSATKRSLCVHRPPSISGIPVRRASVGWLMRARFRTATSASQELDFGPRRPPRTPHAEAYILFFPFSFSA